MQPAHVALHWPRTQLFVWQYFLLWFFQYVQVRVVFLFFRSLHLGSHGPVVLYVFQLLCAPALVASLQHRHPHHLLYLGENMNSLHPAVPAALAHVMMDEVFARKVP